MVPFSAETFGVKISGSNSAGMLEQSCFAIMKVGAN